jgi:hypothetical protein
MNSLCLVCQKRELVAIEIEVGAHELVLVSCVACGSRWWHRDGVETQATDVIDLVRMTEGAKAHTNNGRQPKSVSLVE